MSCTQVSSPVRVQFGAKQVVGNADDHEQQNQPMEDGKFTHDVPFAAILYQ
jgi:hypothetical protein